MSDTEVKHYGILRINRDTGELFLCHHSFNDAETANISVVRLQEAYGETHSYAIIELPREWEYREHYK